MTAGAGRRRAAVLIVLALACGGFASSQVSGRIKEVESRIGSPLPVVVAGRDLPPGTKLRARDLAIAQVPRRFVPDDAPARADQVVGLRVAGPVAAGSPLTGGVLADGEAEQAGSGTAGLRRGERAIDVAVVAGAPLAAGERVDVVVSSDGAGVGRTAVALEDVELLALAPLGTDRVEGGGDAAAVPPPDRGPGADAATALATLRVTARQAVYLAAAQSFAREVRLLARPPGDRRRIGRAAVSADGL